MNRKFIIKLTSFIFAIALFMGVGLLFNNLGLTTVVFAAEEGTYSDSGSCGTSTNWYYYEETSTLRIDGSGSIKSYNVGATPWYSYRNNIKKIIVSDDITSISSSLFSGMSALEELTVPFIGSTLGYMFGTTTYTNAVQTKQYYYYNGTAH
ncbi:MAG: hypothetical protein IJQ07_04570, partial [Clostridia bacterium]|nr:hypothetical protein [Clostridia bacterium]